ncbi:hypothetical protein GCM10023188_26720 [Pontibacter saemangeumensis]|uniref:Uncharacterized protein n=1 Tax=Pontibacter saemangeumensis TaxID=1084525 RepID=A0ABP8LUD4_9BACT
MKTLLRKVVKACKPKYEVVFTTYQIIPGRPVSKNESKHSFGRGESREAKEFYGKVVSSDYTRNLAPAEVHLRRVYLRNKTIERTQFGPVEDLRKFKIVYNK